MGEVIRNVIVRYKLEAIDSQVKVPNVKPGIKAIATVDKKIEESTKSKIQNEMKVEAQVEKTTKSVVRQAKSVKDFSLKAKSQMISAGEGFRSAAEGAFTMARGIAFLTASSDEDLQKMIRTIVKIQGAFDLFKGASQVITGVGRALVNLRQASELTAAANTRLAASNTFVATTGAGATASMIGLTGALGTLAIAAGAVGAVYLLLRLNSPADAIDKTTDSLNRNIEAMQRQAQLRGNLADIRAGGEAARQARGRERRGFLDPTARVGAVDSRLAALDRDEALDKGPLLKSAAQRRVEARVQERRVSTAEKQLAKEQAREVDVEFKGLESTAKFRRDAARRLVTARRNVPLFQGEEAVGEKKRAEAEIAELSIDKNRAEEETRLLLERRQARAGASAARVKSGSKDIAAAGTALPGFGVGGALAVAAQQAQVAGEIATLRKKETAALKAASKITVAAVVESIGVAERMENLMENQQRRIAALDARILVLDLELKNLEAEANSDK